MVQVLKKQKVLKIIGNENKIQIEDGSFIDYDLLCVNVGSRTRGTKEIPGVWEHTLATRPISLLMRNIIDKENYLLKNKMIPKVAVCGGGASGIELAFSFKSRWSKLFGQHIDVTIITSRSNVLEGYNQKTL